MPFTNFGNELADLMMGLVLPSASATTVVGVHFADRRPTLRTFGASPQARGSTFLAKKQGEPASYPRRISPLPRIADCTDQDFRRTSGNLLRSDARHNQKLTKVGKV
jgi:hypothetical protein